ncbi:adenylyltransferase/cytidyltransferase family protein [Cellulomonas sp. NS3]|uniref:adenylyltransferase/cytidyltransferase family protein n=1 Tax=Cellulomonas sp. NS3 TaxID=2973977 RepID=UPI0021621194|nr:adenylyltransferase/cytidyltransferase family protein [Cellulomonas sp. NS3]
MARIGYAPGAYDLFHVGHLNILRLAKQHCDHLIAGVVSDEMLELTKGSRPVVPLAERMEIVRHISFVDEVVAEVVPDKVDTWRSVGFDVIFKGDDWRGTPKGDKLERDFAAVGVEVHYFPYTAHTSSTALRRALARLDGVAPPAEEPAAAVQVLPAVGSELLSQA